MRRLALLAVALGVLAAVVVALAVPTSSTGEQAGSQKAITVLPRPPAKPVRGQLFFVPQRGTVHVAARLADERGGPPFAVRVFRAKRVVPAGSPPSLEHARLLGHDLCGQLGRIYHGKFGWLDARRRFRPANFAYSDAPMICGDRWRDDRSRAQVKLTTLISDPSAGVASEQQSVAWGFGGGLTTRVDLQDAQPAVGREGAFLAHVARGTHANELTARFHYRGRESELVPFSYIAGTRNGPGLPGDRAKAIAGTAVIEARAPDPGGGLAWGLLGYRTDSNDWCVTQPGRIVGDRVGTVNFVLGTFDDIWDVGRQCDSSVKNLPPNWPAALGSSFGGGLIPQSLDPTADPQTGRTRLRTLPGRTVLYGVARPGVRQVTLASPRDVRTLIPSARAHSLIAVYDGTFPSGEMKLTATMADGSHKTVRQLAGF